jgi:cholesterol oxidase
MRFNSTLCLVSALCVCQTASADDPSKYDAIVIGSGYGGSVAALRLGQHDIDTLVLERGREWKVLDPTTNSTFGTLEDVLSQNQTMAGKTTWRNTQCAGNLYLSPPNPTLPCPYTTGVLEVVDGSPETHSDASPKLKMNNVGALAAAGVGGGSLVNNGITYAPTAEGYALAFPASEMPWMAKIWKSLSRTYFKRAFAGLRAEVIPPDILARPEYLGTRLMDGYFAALGYPREDPNVPSTLTFGRTFAPTLVSWNKVREETTGERVPSVIKGEAWVGNNSGARKSLDMPGSYLGKAVATGNVTIKPLHTVTSIGYDKKKKLYSVNVVRTDENYTTLENLVFRTPHLIMAAGSLGSTKLLVRARDTGALPKLNRHVGTHWSSNGNMGHLRVTGAPAPIGQGGLGGIKVTDFADPNKGPVVLENLPQRAPAFGAPQDALLTIGLGIPTGKGTFRYEATTDTVVLDWPADGAKNVYDRVTEIYASIQPPQGFVQLPMEAAMGYTLHPLGGLPLGLATDKRCTLKGYDGLYAVDGAIMPGPAAVTNPSLLITALAERCLDRIVEDITGDCEYDNDD